MTRAGLFASNLCRKWTGSGFSSVRLACSKRFVSPASFQTLPAQLERISRVLEPTSVGRNRWNVPELFQGNFRLLVTMNTECIYTFGVNLTPYAVQKYVLIAHENAAAFFSGLFHSKQEIKKEGSKAWIVDFPVSYSLSACVLVV